MTVKKEDKVVALTTGAASEFSVIATPEADIREIISANLQGEMIETNLLKQIKVPSGGGTTWEIPELTGIESVRELKGIIVHSEVGRAYWKEAYGVGESGPPNCSSDDAIHGRDRETGDRIECASCSLSQYGSAIDKNGKPGAGQACSQKRILFLVREDNLLPVVVSIPAGSLKAASQYLLNLTSAQKRLHHVVSTLSLKTSISKSGVKFSEVVFSVGKEDYLPKDQIKKIDAYVAAIGPALTKTARNIRDVKGDANSVGVGAGSSSGAGMKKAA